MPRRGTAEETKMEAVDPFKADSGDEFCVIVDDDRSKAAATAASCSTGAPGSDGKKGGSGDRPRLKKVVVSSLVFGEILPPMTCDLHYPLEGYSKAKVVWNSVPSKLETLDDNDRWWNQQYLKYAFREPSQDIDVRSGKPRTYSKVSGKTPFPVCLLLSCETLDDRLKVLNWWLSLGDKGRDTQWTQLCGCFVHPRRSSRRFSEEDYDFRSRYRIGSNKNQETNSRDPASTTTTASTPTSAMVSTSTAQIAQQSPPINHGTPRNGSGGAPAGCVAASSIPGASAGARAVSTQDASTAVTYPLAGSKRGTDGSSLEAAAAKKVRTPQKVPPGNISTAKSAGGAPGSVSIPGTARARPPQDLCPSVEVIVHNLQVMYASFHLENPDRNEADDEKVLLSDKQFRAGVLLLRELHQHFERIYSLEARKVLLVCKQVRSPTGTPKDHGCTEFSIHKLHRFRHDTEAMCKACREQRKLNEVQQEKDAKEEAKLEQMRQRYKKMTEKNNTHKRSILRLQKRVNAGKEKLKEREEKSHNESSDEEDDSRSEQAQFFPAHRYRNSY